MTFPLGEWIATHSDVPHNLGRSGMVGSLLTTPAIVGSAGPGEPEELIERLAVRLRVDRNRVFLTTGSTEANFDALVYLHREASRRSGRTPRVRAPTPEYPPLADTATAVGFRPVGPAERAEVTVCSLPNNPRGTASTPAAAEALAEKSGALLVDETFREFTTAASLAGAGVRGRWVTGTFTKVYGADAIRVGYVVPPPEEVPKFRYFADRVMHEIAPASVGAALAILGHRTEILKESRGLFRDNLATLRRRVAGVPVLAAPTWFDQGEGVLPGDALARRALDAGVLVCSGSFFGDGTGVRVTLTRRSFPADLDAYLAVRSAYL